MRRFVVEPVVLAMFPELLHPLAPVEFVIPYSTIEELYLFRREKFLTSEADYERITEGIERLIAFFESPLVAKKINRIAQIPWRFSSPIIWDESVTFSVVNVIEQEEYGEVFDPIETELILLAEWQKIPLLIEDVSLQDRIIEFEIPIQVFDVSDFDYAVEEGGTLEEKPDDLSTPLMLVKNDAPVPLSRKDPDSADRSIPNEAEREESAATVREPSTRENRYLRGIVAFSSLCALLGTAGLITYRIQGQTIPLWADFLTAYGWVFLIVLAINRFAFRVRRGGIAKNHATEGNRSEPIE
jgi:hypothetical protein